MDGFPVLKENHTQVLPAGLWNPGPESDPAFSLQRLRFGFGNDTFYPLILDLNPVRAAPNVHEVLRELHC